MEFCRICYFFGSWYEKFCYCVLMVMELISKLLLMIIMFVYRIMIVIDFVICS